MIIQGITFTAPGFWILEYQLVHVVDPTKVHNTADILKFSILCWKDTIYISSLK